jgi:hypothetical protein
MSSLQALNNWNNIIGVLTVDKANKKKRQVAYLSIENSDKFIDNRDSVSMYRCSYNFSLRNREIFSLAWGKY